MINKKTYKKTVLSLFAVLSLSQIQAFAGGISAIDPLFAVSDNTRILTSQRPDSKPSVKCIFYPNFFLFIFA